MRQNSFQKNGLLNVNNVNSNSAFMQNPNQLGRRSIDDIKNDMFNAKVRKTNLNVQKTEEKNINNNQDNMKNRIDYLKRIDNMNRWK